MTHTHTKKAQPFEFILAPPGKRTRGRGKTSRKIGKATPKGKQKQYFRDNIEVEKAEICNCEN